MPLKIKLMKKKKIKMKEKNREYTKNKKQILKRGILFLIFLFFLVFLNNFLNKKNVFAEEKQNLEKICQNLIDNGQQNLSKNEYQNLLKQCQSFYEKEIIETEKDIKITKTKKSTLENKIWLLNKKIKNLNYQIYQSNLIIKDLKTKIKDTKESIKETSLKIEKSKKQLSKILEIIAEEDKKSIIEILFSENSLSDFFNDLIGLEHLSNKNKELLKDIKSLKENLVSQKTALEEERSGLERTIQIQSLQKEKSARIKKEQEKYLTITKQEYQKKIKEKEKIEKKAAAIKAKIYQLIGARKEITYKQALEIAKYVSSLVGVRPALLLGILSQESAIGRNVGQCYLKNPNTGAGVIAYSGKYIERVMKPSRDVPYFLRIIKNLNKEKNLNLNPFKTLVSCPMSIGWGGAMGPAQFIPSTWVLYENKIKEKTGITPDPWDIRDATIAAAIYLKNEINKYGTERAAVQSYFCGRPKNTYWCKWYEKNVLYLANCHQQFIDNGSMSLSCQRDIGLK